MSALPRPRFPDWASLGGAITTRRGLRRAQAAVAGAWLLPVGLALAAGNSPPTSGITGNQETLSLATALFKTIGSLAVVLGLMFLLLLLFKKLGLSRPAASRQGLIRILDIQPLSPKKQVAILELAGEYVAVGITEQSISLLANLSPNDQLLNAAAPASPETTSFAAILSRRLGSDKAPQQSEEGPIDAS